MGVGEVNEVGHGVQHVRVYMPW
ncbi:hypothetical protein F383_29581 [Gossypium arboreum]|uniref:Uncharacterized protein n=1 Tax=Gossypium arboreum TaxID=29729 RepID=A0A0B0PH97_GOSAR|nr:hypothetical protein F383_29581 [Gossypium arboreum]